ECAGAPGAERVIGDRDRQEPGGGTAPDERAETAAERPDLSLRRWPSLREDDERSARANKVDQRAKIGCGSSRPATPEVVERGRVVRARGLPEKICVIAAEHIPAEHRARQTALTGAVGEGIDELARESLRERGVGELSH